VAWTVDDLEFYVGHMQDPFQGGRNVIRATFTEHVQLSHNCCIDIIDYRRDYHHDPIETKKIHVPWYPGESGL
jgi:hypothetical protein